MIDKTMRTHSSKNILTNKEAENPPDAVEQYFPGFLAFIDSTEQQKYQDL